MVVHASVDFGLVLGYFLINFYYLQILIRLISLVKCLLEASQLFTFNLRLEQVKQESVLLSVLGRAFDRFSVVRQTFVCIAVFACSWLGLCVSVYILILHFHGSSLNA